MCGILLVFFSLVCFPEVVGQEQCGGQHVLPMPAGQSGSLFPSVVGDQGGAEPFSFQLFEGCQLMCEFDYKAGVGIELL